MKAKSKIPPVMPWLMPPKGQAPIAAFRRPQVAPEAAARVPPQSWPVRVTRAELEAAGACTDAGGLPAFDARAKDGSYSYTRRDVDRLAKENPRALRFLVARGFLPLSMARAREVIETHHPRKHRDKRRDRKNAHGPEAPGGASITKNEKG